MRLFYTVNGKNDFLDSTNPLLVKEGKAVPLKTTVFIDDSGSMTDIDDNIVAAIADEAPSSADILFPYDERWILWIEKSLSPSSESLALIFIDESSFYLYTPHWLADLEFFLNRWKKSPKSYAHVFVINDEGEYSLLLAEQVSAAFSRLTVTGYSYSVNSPDSLLGTPPGGRGTGDSYREPDPRKKIFTKTAGAISRFLRTIPGGYLMEVFAAPSFNKEAILTMKANNQPIPDWMFHGPILTERSENEINITFGCDGRCDTESFELESNVPPGYDCFSYQVAIDWLEEMNSSCEQILNIL